MSLTELTLKVQFNHDPEWDPAEHFVWYVDDCVTCDGQPAPIVLFEEWDYIKI